MHLFMFLNQFADTKTLDHVYPTDLIAATYHYLDKIKVLSLDCFDTLLWRKTALPADVFFDLQHKSAFKEIGLTPTLRITLEAKARGLKFLREKSTEVNLHDIYRAGFPDLHAEQLNQLVEDELSAEIAACYAFTPIIELMRAAQARGISIIIVSNTYLTKPQLQRLITEHLPSDLVPTISDIFCSCEYGVSKNNGLFRYVLEKTNLSASTLLHIGDDEQADLLAAREEGLNALRLMRHHPAMKEFFRLHAAAASVFQPTIRHTQGLASPFHAIFSSKKIERPEQIIGYASVGPIMYAFADFIKICSDNLAKTGKQPKIAFLLRDAHLPAKVCNVLFEKDIGKNIRISRFAAYAATFRTAEDIDKYLVETVFTCRFRDICRQLLLPDEITEPLVQVVTNSSSPIMEFLNHIHTPAIQNIIFYQSKQYRTRLLRYLQKEMSLQAGDTLMFVDLGYSGTTQRLLEPVLREELQIELKGCYLIELTVPNWKKSRCGLIDPSWCDERAMLSLVNYIALLEQICTSTEKSIVDYDNDGNPIFSETTLEKNQHEKLEKIQTECINFARDAQNFFAHTSSKPAPEILRETTLSELGRLLFLPTESEIDYLVSFKFDLNLGTHDVLRVFDTEAGLSSLRKRGLFFSAMEKNQKSIRTNYPAELRAAGLELVMTLMTQCRFAIELGFQDMSLRHESLDIAVSENNSITHSKLSASLTYDGYYSLSVPINNDIEISILVGKQYAWLECHSAELIELSSYLNKSESIHAKDYWQHLVFHDMTNKGGKLFECQSEASAIIIQPPKHDSGDKNYIVRLIFRPTVTRIKNKTGEY